MTHLAITFLHPHCLAMALVSWDTVRRSEVVQMSKLVLDLRLPHLTVGLHLQHLAADLLTEGLFVGGDVDWAREVVAEIEVAELAVAAVGLDLSKMGLAPRRPWRRTFATARTWRVKCGWREWR
jgi:hypothetical protein